MPKERFVAKSGFAVTGNRDVPCINEGQEFMMDIDVNKWGYGKGMVSVYNEKGVLIGFVTTGQATIIREGGA